MKREALKGNVDTRSVVEDEKKSHEYLSHSLISCFSSSIILKSS
jgi:hypothetical protein